MGATRRDAHMMLTKIDARNRSARAPGDLYGRTAQPASQVEDVHSRAKAALGSDHVLGVRQRLLARLAAAVDREVVGVTPELPIHPGHAFVITAHHRPVPLQ